MGQVKELLLSVKDMLERDAVTVHEAETLYNEFGIAFPTNNGVSKMDVFDYDLTTGTLSYEPMKEGK